MAKPKLLLALTPTENKLLVQMHKDYGISRQEVIRRLILGIKLPKIVYADNVQYRKQSQELSRIADALSQLGTAEQQRNLTLFKRLYLPVGTSDTEARMIKQLRDSTKSEVEPRLKQLTQKFIHLEWRINAVLSNHDIRYREHANGHHLKGTKRRLRERLDDKR